MDKNELLNNNINDLNIAHAIATDIKNDSLKKYTIDRLKSMNENLNLFQNTDISLLVDSYIIDITLLINVSKISNMIEEKDYFKSKLIDLMNKFQDKVNFLVYSNRVENLVNEQQYLYVNVEVIKDEVMSIWNRGDDNTTSGKSSSKKDNKKSFVVEETPEVAPEEPVETEEFTQTPVTDEITINDSMYDEELPTEGAGEIEVIDYLE